MFWDANNETLDRNSLEKLQLRLLQKTVERARQAPYYGELFKRLPPRLPGSSTAILNVGLSVPKS